MTAALTDEIPSGKVLDFAAVAGLLLPLPEPDAGWMARGQCRQADPESFFPDKGGSTKAAKRVCQACPVRAECLAYALDNDERFGVWGGLSERERRRANRDQPRAAS